MSKQEYYLVNPLIGGNMKTKFSGKNDLDAAKKAYDSISEYFNNNVPEFNFTLQKIVNDKSQIGAGKNTDYLHFKSTEKKKGNTIDFRLVPFKVTKNTKEIKRFREQIKKIENRVQNGGGKHHDDDDDDDHKSHKKKHWLDDDEDEDWYFPKLRRSTFLASPISYYWYDPYIYRTNYHFVPTWVAPLAPYVQIPLYLP